MAAILGAGPLVEKKYFGALSAAGTVGGGVVGHAGVSFLRMIRDQEIHLLIGTLKPGIASACVRQRGAMPPLLASSISASLVNSVRFVDLNG